MCKNKFFKKDDTGMLVNFARTIFLYLIVTVTMRILGKKQVGQLETSEFVIVLLLSELAAVPMQDTDIPLINSIVPIVTLLSLELFLSAGAMKIKWLRDVLQGKPVIIISHGKMDVKNLKATRYNIDEVMEEIRRAGYADIRDVEFAVLENSGTVSVIPSARGKAVTTEDLKLNVSGDAMPYIVINDGVIDKSALSAAGISENQLEKLLAKNKISTPDKVFFAVFDSAGEFYFQLKQEDL